MRLFEADEFEERIQAVENRAGRIAWRVFAAALIFTLVLHQRITGEEHNTLIYFIPYTISWLVYLMIRKKSGVDEKQIAEEKRRLGQTTAWQRIIRKNMIEAVTVLGILFFYIASDDLSTEGILILSTFILAIIGLIYYSERTAYGRKLFGARTREEDAP